MAGDYRKRIPKRIAYSLLRRANATCCLCTLEFGDTPDKHHIEYYSLGGEDTEDNLVAICQTCHKHVHKGLFGTATVIRKCRDNWFAYQERLGAIYGALSVGSFERATRLISEPDLRRLALNSSSYGHLNYICDVTTKFMPCRTAQLRAEKFKIQLLSSELCCHLNLAAKSHGLATQAGRFFEKSRDLKRQLVKSRLLAGMAAGKLHRCDSERVLLEKASEDLHECSKEEQAEWTFRYAAFQNQVGEPDEARKTALNVLNLRAPSTKRIAGSLLGEVGMSELLCGHHAEAKRILIKALDQAVHNAHPRGICVRHYALAAACSAAGEYRQAIRHSLISRRLDRTVGAPVMSLLNEVEERMIMHLGWKTFTELRSDVLMDSSS